MRLPRHAFVCLCRDAHESVALAHLRAPGLARGRQQTRSGLPPERMGAHTRACRWIALLDDQRLGALEREVRDRVTRRAVLTRLRGELDRPRHDLALEQAGRHLALER